MKLTTYPENFPLQKHIDNWESGNIFTTQFLRYANLDEIRSDLDLVMDIYHKSVRKSLKRSMQGKSFAFLSNGKKCDWNHMLLIRAIFPVEKLSELPNDVFEELRDDNQGPLFACAFGNVPLISHLIEQQIREGTSFAVNCIIRTGNLAFFKSVFPEELSYYFPDRSDRDCQRKYLESAIASDKIEMVQFLLESECYRKQMNFHMLYDYSCHLEQLLDVTIGIQDVEIVELVLNKLVQANLFRDKLSLMVKTLTHERVLNLEKVNYWSTASYLQSIFPNEIAVRFYQDEYKLFHGIRNESYYQLVGYRRVPDTNFLVLNDSHVFPDSLIVQRLTSAFYDRNHF